LDAYVFAFGSDGDSETDRMRWAMWFLLTLMMKYIIVYMDGIRCEFHW
jgi:hypothetical protein